MTFFWERQIQQEEKIVFFGGSEISLQKVVFLKEFPKNFQKEFPKKKIIYELRIIFYNLVIIFVIIVFVIESFSYFFLSVVLGNYILTLLVKPWFLNKETVYMKWNIQPETFMYTFWKTDRLDENKIHPTDLRSFCLAVPHRQDCYLV